MSPVEIRSVEIWTDKTDFRKTRAVWGAHPPLEDGRIRVAIDKFALTSNNVTYAVSGDMIGYWKFFPTDDEPWGKVPVWGMADVVEGNHPEIEVGERLYGFFPMANHLVLKPGKAKPGYFVDTTEHRASLPGLYNQYMRCRAEPDFMKGLEDERCALFPLFMTGYMIADFLMDNDWFGAEQIIVGSVSSKTGFSLAAFLRDLGFTGRIVGLTSPGTAKFVETLGVCDLVATYDRAAEIDDVPSVFVDMAGDGAVRSTLHHRLGDNMKSSQAVGATHWRAGRERKKLPGAGPELFFAPAVMEKRNRDWGPGVLMEKCLAASTGLTSRFKDILAFERHAGAEAAQTVWRDLLDNRISGQRGIMVSLGKDE